MAAGAFFDDDFDDGGMEGFAAVSWGGAAFDVMDGCAFVDDDEGAFELAHVFGVDAEVGLEWHVDVDAGWDINEGAAGPNGGVEGGEFVVGGGDDAAEVFFEIFGVFLEGDVGGFEEDAFFGEIFAEGVVDDFGFELGAGAGEEFAFGFGDAEFFEGVFDFWGDVVPRSLLFVLRSEVVMDVFKVDAGKVAAPSGHGFVAEDFEGI